MEQTTEIATIRARFANMKTTLGQAFRERDNAVEAILLAVLSGNHALLVGPPGTAKSALFEGVLSHFGDARQFRTLVTKFATEDEMFGPVMLSALKNDRWERNLTGRLAGVECAFLDEVFKGSDSVLNTFLSAMNERLYKGAAIPLRFLCGASNELPEDEILAAVYDRFLLRDVVEYIGSDSVWCDLLCAPPKYQPNPADLISLDDWTAARLAVDAIDLPRAIVEELLKIKKACAAQGIVCSDRRWLSLTRVLRAAAWLDGAVEVEIDHLSVLRYGLWTKPEERARINAILATLAKSVVAEAVEIIDGALRVFRSRPIEASALHDAGPAIADEIAKSFKRVKLLTDGKVPRHAAAKINGKLKELAAARDVIRTVTSARYGWSAAS